MWPPQCLHLANQSPQCWVSGSGLQRATGTKIKAGGRSCVHYPLSPFRDRDKLPLKQMTLGPGSFSKDTPDFGTNVQKDRQTDRQTHTDTDTHTHTQCCVHTPTPSGAFISQKGWGKRPGFSTPPLFSLPPSIFSSSLLGACLNRQPGQTWQTYWKASQNPHANHKPICVERDRGILGLGGNN